MKNLTVLKERAERLSVSIGECKDIADEIDEALKSAAKVLTPKQIKESADRISRSANQSAAHDRNRG